MNGKRGRRLSRRDARRILRGDHTAAGPALRGVLASASAPASPGELAGERAAMAAFTASVASPAQPSGVASAGAGRSRAGKWAGALTTRFAAIVAAVVVVAGGGLAAVAATTGLPGHGNAPAHPSSASVVPGPGDTNTPGGSDGTVPSGGAGGTADAPRPTTPAGEGDPNAIPSPSPAGLCRAYIAGGDHGKVLDNPAFTALITYAGGRDKVDAYCDGMLAAPNPGDGRTGSHSTPQSSHHPPERR
jgi:hypothetical protein